MNHTCVASQYKHQGRCSICGRFMSAPYPNVSAGLINQPHRKIALYDKDEIIDKLRETTCVVEYEKFGKVQTHAFSLEPKYLGNYVGSGKSKNTNNDTLFLYDTDSDKFRRVFVSGIKSVVEV